MVRLLIPHYRKFKLTHQLITRASIFLLSFFSLLSIDHNQIFNVKKKHVFEFTYFDPAGRRASFGANTFEKVICFSGGGPPFG